MFFQPYVGQNYEHGFKRGRKLLLLGESHYHPGYVPEKHDPPEFSGPYTQDVVEQALRPGCDYAGPSSFFGRLHRLLTGSEGPTEPIVREAWTRVAYANYVQAFVGDGAHAKKTNRHWQSGQEALPGLLDLLRPDRVLVLGKATWDALSYGVWRDRSWQAGGVDRGLWALPFSGGEALATWVKHPSRAFETDAVRHSTLDGLLDL